VGTKAYLALGSNLGERLDSLREAVRLLDAAEGVDVVRSSRIYETDPVGPPQPAYLNAVIEVETSRSPRELLQACRAVEDALGRVRTERWGPRTIDVDILTFDERTVDEPDLQIPHPRMHERGFVLVPWASSTTTRCCRVDERSRPCASRRMPSSASGRSRRRCRWDERGRLLPVRLAGDGTRPRLPVMRCPALPATS
jgi:2-amino-4-hydroxy-6-hydroxymethyldihydropteridine diphosphokinase